MVFVAVGRLLRALRLCGNAKAKAKASSGFAVGERRDIAPETV
jgi:hypothetical protein